MHISWVDRIARGRRIVFKLHPNEDHERATAEVAAKFPDALVFASGDTNAMIANCEALITQYSTVIYTGLALGKECYSYLDVAELRRLVPLQNGGTSARNIAAVCTKLLARAASRPALAPLERAS